MIVHDCTRLVQAISFVENECGHAKSGWFLDYFFRDRTTEAEKLVFRNYTKSQTAPLFYTGACLPPNLIKPNTESVTLRDINFPTIKAEGKITGCDVDERRITAQGQILPIGQQRYDEAFNWQMMSLFDGLRATHILEAISLLKNGGYVLKDTNTSKIGTIDYGRTKELQNIDLVGTDNDWSSLCINPLDTVRNIVRNMACHGGVAGTIDIIYGDKAWEAMQAHKQREGIRYHTMPSDTFMNNAMTYSDVEYMGTSDGNKYRHWVSSAKFIDYDGVLKPVIEANEIMIASKDAFDGQRIFRTITSDNKERLPEGANFFVYDDMEKEYDRKCRSFNPWIEEYHVMATRNVNSVTVVKVVPEDFKACIECDECKKKTEGGKE